MTGAGQHLFEVAPDTKFLRLNSPSKTSLPPPPSGGLEPVSGTLDTFTACCGPRGRPGTSATPSATAKRGLMAPAVDQLKQLSSQVDSLAARQVLEN